jgi:hypothetical protein
MQVKILQTFIGFPDGEEKPERTFVADATPDVDAAFGKLIIEKGLAELLPAKPVASKAEVKREAE